MTDIDVGRKDGVQWTIPSYGDAAAAIDIPLKRWAGNCHGISTLLVNKGIVPGVVRRGYWLGDCAPNAYFRSNFAQHSWIELPNSGVCDPTGFAFQLANSGTPEFVTPDPTEPLLTFIGIMADTLYDIGGCRMFSKTTGPPPDASAIYEEENPIMLEGGAFQYIADLLGADPTFVYETEPTAIEVTSAQAMWLANLPVLDKEGPLNLSRWMAAEVYEMLVNAGHRAMIPIDRLDWIAPDLRQKDV